MKKFISRLIDKYGEFSNRVFEKLYECIKRIPNKFIASILMGVASLLCILVIFIPFIPIAIIGTIAINIIFDIAFAFIFSKKIFLIMIIIWCLYKLGKTILD